MAAAKGGGLLFHFDHSPRAIVAALTNLYGRKDAVRAQLTGSRRKLAVLLLAGMAMVTVDVLFGYRSHLYTWVGIGLIVLAIWAWRRRNRSARQPAFDRQEIVLTSRVVHTIRDDIDPKRNLHGTLDLRGPSEATKSKVNARGRTVSYYRDDWLSMKARLWDGSMLRFDVFRKLKVRDGYYKTGRVSGKRKFKPPVTKARVDYVIVRVSPNPELYSISRLRAPTVGQRLGRTVIEDVTLDGGLIRLRASHPGDPSPDELLSLLLATYGSLETRAVA